jgi:hypothetical protein
MNKRMASLSKGAVPEISWRRIRLYRLVSYRSVPAFPSTGSDPLIARLLAPSHRVTRQCRLGLPSALESGSPLREMDSNFWFLVAKGQTVIRDGTAVSKTGADLLGNRRFESISLQRGVESEPDFRQRCQDSGMTGHEVAGRLQRWLLSISRWNVDGQSVAGATLRQSSGKGGWTTRVGVPLSRSTRRPPIDISTFLRYR